MPRWLLAVIGMGCLGVSVGAAQRQVTLGWDPNPEMNLVEYRIHYGFSPGVYVATIPVGLVTRVILSLPVPGIRYFFAVSAVNEDGLESDKSNVVPHSEPSDGTPVELFGSTVRTPEDVPVAFTLSAGPPPATIQWVLVEPPRRGRLEGTAPSLTYVPSPDYAGTDSFRYFAMIGAARIVQVTTSLIVDPVPDAPLAIDLDYTTARGEPIAIRLEAFDVDSPVLTYEIVRPPRTGQLSGTPPNLTYMPGPDFAELDDFIFRARDEGGLESNPAIVRIREEIDTEPLLREETLAVVEDTPVPVPMRVEDEDGNPLSIEIIDDPEHGLVLGTPPNVTFHPATNYFGTDVLRYLEIPEAGRPTEVTVWVTVTPVNDAPVATDLAIEAIPGVPTTVVLVGIDVEEDPLIFRVLTMPTEGWLSGEPPNLVYVANPGFLGEDSFTYTVADAEFESEPATVVLTVVPGIEVVLKPDTAPGGEGRWLLEWQGKEEVEYRVLYKADMGAPEWTVVGSMVPTETGVVVWPVEIGGEVGFYAIEAIEAVEP